MKRVFCFLCSLCLLLSLLACTQESVDVPTAGGDRIEAPICYRVTDAAGHEVYLLGSIHIGEEGMWPLNDYIMNAFAASDALALELDPDVVDYAALTQSMMGMMYQDGTTLKDYVSEEVYTKAVEALTESGLYIPGMERYNAGLWYLMLSSAEQLKSGLDSSLGVDMQFSKFAKEQNKPILEVEGTVAQMDMIASFSEELQLFLLNDLVENFGRASTQEEYAALLDAWKRGDVAAMLGETDELQVPLGERELYKEYVKKMITDRNIKMADYAENALKGGQKIFICVGAAHVVGEGGMADLLAKRGYTVEDLRPLA